jgi:hypothetical protein
VPAQGLPLDSGEAMTDSLRPRGIVEVTCRCGMAFWISALDPRLPDGPFLCPDCSGEKPIKELASGVPSKA